LFLVVQLNSALIDAATYVDSSLCFNCQESGHNLLFHAQISLTGIESN